jgi:hypothetical protein
VIASDYVLQRIELGRSNGAAYLIPVTVFLATS